MISLMRLLVCGGIMFAPQCGVAAEHNAFHVFGQDSIGLMGFVLAGATIYTPNINLENNSDSSRPKANNVLLNCELDEIYMRISFKSGITPSIDLLQGISYGYELGLTPSNCDMKHKVVGQNLYVWYGFHDNRTPPVISTDSKWKFEVAGSFPVAAVDLFVSYHSRALDAMPDLWKPLGVSLRALTPADARTLALELPEEVSSAGMDLSSMASAKKIIVLVHGWNPDMDLNPYAWDPRTWQSLTLNLLANPVVSEQTWTIARYDWGLDAATGDRTSEPIDNPNASRDAASAHGLNLGRALATKSPTHVHFIAHSAGNWAVKRAAAYLRHKFGAAIQIGVTSLDPFVNDGDAASGMDLAKSFEMMSDWTDYRENYYVEDISDILGWTSGDFDPSKWKNRQLDAGGYLPQYEEWMGDEHRGPTAWFAKTVGALRNIDLLGLDIGFIYSLPMRRSSANDNFPGEQLSGLTGDRTWFNYRATSQANEPAHAGGTYAPAHTVWGSWTPTVSGNATFRCDGNDLENSAGVSVTPIMAVYSGSTLAGLSKLATNGPTQAWLTFSATAGTTYRIAVDGPYESGVGNAIGTIPLHWSMEGAPASTVAITAPAGGATVNGTVAVAATASGATKAEFYLDGVLQATDYAAPFTWSWNTLAAANRDHALVAKSYNGSQLLDSSPAVVVTVNNSIVVPPVVAPDGYEPNNSSTTAYGPVASGTPLSARVDSPTDVDWFKVTLSEPGVIHLALGVPAANDYDLELYGPSGTWVAGSYKKAGINESLDYAATAAGTYAFRVYGYPVGSGSFNTNTLYTLDYAFTSGSGATCTLTANAVHGLVSRSPSMDAYTSGSMVTLTANPSPGYQFTGWGGDLSGTTNPATLVMNGNKNISAGFTASTGDVGSITVTIQPPEAAAAGAQWKLTTESGWHNSGASVSGLAVGAYVVQYNAPSGWYSPANRQVDLKSTDHNVRINQSILQQSTDPLDSWTWRNPLPQGAHLSDVAYGNGLYVAIGPGKPQGMVKWGGRVCGTIITSSDGITWTNQNSGTTNRLVAITFGGGLFVAVGDRGIIVTSSDGLTWTPRSSGTILPLLGLAYGNGQFVAVGELSDNPGVIVASSDGVTWTSREHELSASLQCVTYGNGQFVVAGTGRLDDGTWTGENIFTSSDGITWTGWITASHSSIMSLTYGNGLFVACQAPGCILTSPDGELWTQCFSTWPSLHEYYLFNVRYGNGRFVAVGQRGVIVTSSDGINWSGQILWTPEDLWGVTCGDGPIVAVGDYGALYTSPDGGIWSNRVTGLIENLADVTYGDEKFVAVVSSETNGFNIITSLDGVTWISRYTGVRELRKVVYENGTYVAVGTTNIVTSTNGIAWTIRSPGKLYLNDITYGAGQFVAVGSSNIVTSTDGISWTIRNSGGARLLNSVVYGNGQFVAVGTTNGMTSPDGVNWTRFSTSRSFTSIAYGDGKYLAMDSLRLFLSLDGTNWTRISNVALSDYVTYCGGQFIVLDSGASIYTSWDGMTWSIRRFDDESGIRLWGVTYGNGQYVAVGSLGVILQSQIASHSQLTMPPDILVHPVDQELILSGKSTNSVLAVGTYPLFYQWQKNGIPIAGQKSNSMAINNVGTGDAGDYSVIVSNAFGVVTSDVATLTILLSPTVVVPPQNRILAPGGTGTFSVVVNGAAPFSYQWRHNGVALPGANDDMFRITGVQSSDTGTYSVVVSSSGGSVTSAVATLAITLLQLEVSPSSRSVGFAAGSTIFSVTNAGAGTMTYAASEAESWLGISADGATGVNGGTIKVAYTANPGTTARTGMVTVTASGANGSPKLVKIIQEGNPAISTTPSNRTHSAAAAGGQTIMVAANMPWTATANPSWISISGGGTGTGNGTVTYDVEANAGAIRSGTITISGGGITRTFTVNQWPVPATPGVSSDGDVDGDGTADLSVFHPATGNWHVLFNSGAKLVLPWGWSATLPVPADYDGDGLLDLAVYHPATGNWHIQESGAVRSRIVQFGWSTTVPLPGDYDGDGKADMAVFHQAQGRWHFLCTTAGRYNVQWGWSTTIPVPVDYDGDGKTDIAIYHPPSGLWQILKSSTGGVIQKQWGWSTAIPVPADYDNDGRADIAVFHRPTGTWRISYSGGGSRTKQFGWSSTIPVAADYDGDGAADIAVYHPATGNWHILKSTTGATLVKNWGWAAAKPTLLYPLIHSWFRLP